MVFTLGKESFHLSFTTGDDLNQIDIGTNVFPLLQTPKMAVRPRVFLDVQSGSELFGRITIELFNDKTPKTCKK